jgi:hypothetical protein
LSIWQYGRRRFILMGVMEETVVAVIVVEEREEVTEDIEVAREV